MKERAGADTPASNQASEAAIAPSETQAAIVKSLGAHASFDPQTAVPRALRGTLASPIDSPLLEAALVWFDTSRDLYRMRDPRVELVLRRVDTDNLGFERARFGQVHDGIQVYGRELIAHRNTEGVLYAITGNYHPDIALTDTRPISETKAIERAIEILSDTSSVVTSRAEAIIYPLDDGGAVRAWQVTVEPAEPTANHIFRRIFIFDATTGRALIQYDDVPSGRF